MTVPFETSGEKHDNETGEQVGRERRRERRDELIARARRNPHRGLESLNRNLDLLHQTQRGEGPAELDNLVEQCVASESDRALIYLLLAEHQRTEVTDATDEADRNLEKAKDFIRQLGPPISGGGG